MARVLCAWEFGGDLGHIRTLLPIARELRALGHVALFAFRDATRLGAVLEHGFEGFPAPQMRRPRSLDPLPANLSDVLLNLGYEDGAALTGALRAWRSLFELAAVDAVVCEYAPTASLAARAAGLPRMNVGGGFALPAPGDPLPALRPWLKAAPGHLAQCDARLVAAVARALPDGAAAPRSARAVFSADVDLVTTFPELDPFGERDSVSYEGPLDLPSGGLELAWRETNAQARRIFAYLKPQDARFEALVAALHACGAEAVVAAPGLDARQAAAASRASVRVVPMSVDPARLLEQASLCVCHAGPGLAAHAVLAGVPMALLPLQLEQLLVARGLQARGCAMMLEANATDDLAAWIAQALEAPALREGARAIAVRHRGYSFDASARRIAHRVEHLARA
jgi:UDP:flavonoid glycosyltransferase YjiC (YdhE family)